MRSRPRGRRRSGDRGTYKSRSEPGNGCPAAQAAGTPGCRRSGDCRKATPGAPPSQGVPGSRAVRDPVHVRKHLGWEPGDPTSVCRGENCRPYREVKGRTLMTNGRGKSDRFIEPVKSPNNAEGPAAEAMEGRERAKGNLPECNALRTQGRGGAPSARERVRQAARKDKKQRFTALLHHIYDVERLRAAYLAVQKGAAAGVDGETWEHYGENLEANLQDLSQKLKRGAYRARPVRRVYI